MKTDAMRNFPYAENVFGISLNDGERVVFASKIRALNTVEGEFMRLNRKQKYLSK